MAAVLNRAITHQNRIKFHTETHIVPYMSQPISEFLAWVSSILPRDKAKTFKTLFRYPVKTNEVVGTIFDKLSKVFDGRNPAINYQFLNAEQRDDWEWYRQTKLKEQQIWQTDGWEYFKTEINSVLIVDLPKEQDTSDKYPQPYFYWLTVDKIIDYRADKVTGIMDYIVFKQKDDRVAYIDSDTYAILNISKEGVITVEHETTHDLGYCPAKFFWNESISLSDPDVKANPLSKVLSSLDWFLFFHNSKKHLDLHGAYPIYSGYEKDCDFSNEVTGETCSDGFLMSSSGTYTLDSYGAICRCPKCGDKRMAGPGTYVEIPVPDGKDDPDLRNPIQVLTIDKSSLDYNVEEENRLRDQIINSVVGDSGAPQMKQALNEVQVSANFENQSAVLSRIKKGFEEAQHFVDETVCKLRYGNISFVSANINLGTDFYILDAATLREQYKLAKESGASESELDAMHNQILETEHRNDPIQLQRMIMLSEIEPLRHLTRNEAINLYNLQLIPAEELLIKLNFSTFIRRFERENTNVLEFGINLPFYKRVEIITNKLNEYANENRGRLSLDRANQE